MKRAKKRKGIEALRVTHPTSSRATDVFIRKEEQNGKQKGTKTKTEWVPNPATLDHLVAS